LSKGLIPTQYKTKVKELYKRHDCHPYKTLAIPFVQIPLFIIVSMTIRAMAGSAVLFLGDISHLIPLEIGFETGGIEAIQSNLTLRDTTAFLPVMTGLCNLLNVELNAATVKEGAKLRKQVLITWVLRGVSLLIIPIGMQAPSVRAFCVSYGSIHGIF